MSQDGSKFLTPKQVSERYGGQISVSTLAHWRSERGKSAPPFHRLFGKILYPLKELEDWEQKNLYAATADFSQK